MNDIILHHYDTSPFSEKVRLILGAKGCSWQSVTIPNIMPKPDLVALTGGYRRTPVMQLGADIYCDTALIAAKLDELAPTPRLVPPTEAATVRAMAGYADTALFNYSVALVFQPQVLGRMFGGAENLLQALVQDRMAMRKGAPVRRVAAGEARAGFVEALGCMEAQLADGRAFLSGDQPTLADFSTYHPLWFVRRAPLVSSLIEPFGQVAAWMARMKAFGHGTSTKLDSGEAITIAREAKPAELVPFSDADGLAPGARVTIAPTDYALDPVAGDLVLCNATEMALRRHDERAGEVVVHFPRLNYDLRPVSS